MAAVEGLLFGGDRPRSVSRSTTTRPWTIGLDEIAWNENDTRIRLNAIARAWVDLCSSLKHNGSLSGELVREMVPFCSFGVGKSTAAVALRSLPQRAV